MSLLDTDKMEKMLLSKQIGKYLATDLSSHDRREFEEAARRLAHDVCEYVRSVNAHELSSQEELPQDIIRRIAHDVEGVSAPFLTMAKSLSDKVMADIVPSLEPLGHFAIARRKDLGLLSTDALAEHGGEEAIICLVRDDDQKLTEDTLRKIVGRFKENKIVMDNISARPDLSADIVDIIADHISDHCRQALDQSYATTLDAKTVPADGHAGALWTQVSKATKEQIMGLVKDLKAEGRLSNDLTIDMARRGSQFFLEGGLAVLSGMPLARVRQILKARQPKDFVGLMKACGAGKYEIAAYVEVANTLYDQDIPA